MSLSPCADLLVVGREQRMVFLSGETSQWGRLAGEGWGGGVASQPANQPCADLMSLSNSQVAL